MQLSPEAALARAEEAGESVDAYTRRLFLGVEERREALDTAIAKQLTGWTIGRLAPLERNILRLGVYELRYVEEVPAAVAINEAVELAKTFASNEASSLIHGVLGALAPKDQT